MTSVLISASFACPKYQKLIFHNSIKHSQCNVWSHLLQNFSMRTTFYRRNNNWWFQPKGSFGSSNFDCFASICYKMIWKWCTFHNLCSIPLKYWRNLLTKHSEYRMPFINILIRHVATNWNPLTYWQKAEFWSRAKFSKIFPVMLSLI